MRILIDCVSKIAMLLVIILLSAFILSSCTNLSVPDGNKSNISAGSATASEFMHDFDPGKENHYGNTSSNLGNGGYVAFQDNWIYYSCPNSTQLMKMKRDGSQKTVVVEQSDLLYYKYIQVVGDWIYFNAQVGSEHNIKGHNFYKVRTDGAQFTKLIDDVASGCFVGNGYIYYTEYEQMDSTHSVASIVRMKTDGSDKKILFVGKEKLRDSTNRINLMGITDSTIYFTESNNSNNSDFMLYAFWSMMPDGSEAKRLIDYNLKTNTKNKEYITYALCDPLLIGDSLLYYDYPEGTERSSYRLDLKTSSVNKYAETYVRNKFGNEYIGNSKGNLSFFSENLSVGKTINTDASLNVFTDEQNMEWIYYRTGDNLLRVHPDGTGWERLLPDSK